MKIVLKNSVICNKCSQEIESKHRHDFVSCKCGNVAIDGGHDYKKVMGSDYTDNSIYDDGTHELRREHLTWGKNYDENMHRLPETQWIPIKYMTSEHINAILLGGFAPEGSMMRPIFVKELEYRDGKKSNIEA